VNKCVSEWVASVQQQGASVFRRRRSLDLLVVRAEKRKLMVKLPQPRGAFQEHRRFQYERGRWQTSEPTGWLMKLRHHPKSWLRF
jgi:hypothetical protein